ncbi:hypothetical protein [Psychromonas algicola]|uniref:hypothetical protein n=1 Tax=Psychromonas algicola TaxID=2555642 RepID=UPI001067FAA4|nr:hypothetical protein [Psychromonas sp. RZ5]TEW46457.1 hypothetical protein E2R67_13180 [Psychromonas sp. RZ5]
MKKLLIPAAVASIGAAAYLYQQYEQAYNVLDYVPADTVLFAGALKPEPIRDYLALAENYSTAEDIQQLENLYGTAEDATPAKKFLFSLLTEYQALTTDPEQMIKTFGLGETVRSYVYTLGLLPVAKIEIANPQAIWDLLDKHELETGFSHEDGMFGEMAYRIYRVTSPEEETPLDLIIAQKDGFLTITLNTELLGSEKLLAIALGFDKPEHSLADAGTVSDIVKKHKFSQQGVGFLNHVAIIEGITGVKNSLLAEQLTTLSEQSNSQPFAMLQNQVCQAEFTSIAHNWPRTSFGYTQMDVTAEEATIGLSYVIESKSQVILSALKSLRGFIPSYAQDFENNIASVSLGLDVSQLSSSLTAIWNDLQTPTYQCEPLSIMQAQISEAGQSIGMLGMATNMAAGVKGISAGLFDYEVSEDLNGEPQLESLQAVVALHADSPETIFNSLKMFSPELQQVQLTTGGETVSLNEIVPIDPALNINPQVAIKGNHLVIFNGDLGKQAAEKLATEKLSANGLYQTSFDIERIFTPLIDVINASGEDVPEDLMMLLDYNMNMNMNLDINDQGIRFDTVIKTESTKDIK